MQRAHQTDTTTIQAMAANIRFPLNNPVVCDHSRDTVYHMNE